MATGDEAAAAGMDILTGNEQANTLDTEVNKTRDYLATRLGALVGRIFPGVLGATNPPAAPTATAVREALELVKWASSANADGKIPVYHGGGRIAVADPTSTGHAASRGWVEVQLADLPEPSAEADKVSPSAYGREAGAGRFTMWMDAGRFIGRSSSSRRWKNDITPHEFDVEALLSLPVVSFVRDVDLEEGTRDIGLIAEDVAAAGLSELVYTGEDGEVQGIYDHRIVYALLAIVQHQDHALDLLAQRLAALEGNTP